MNNQPVAVLDSGIGGLPYLSWIQENLPQENLVYLADRKNFPYGEKTQVQVCEAAKSGVEALVKRFRPKMLVVACNTASVIALESLRKTYDFPVIGVVPAVKTAAALTHNGRIGVLATQRTIEGEYLQKLIQEFGSDKTVYSLAAADLVNLVEEDYLDPDQKVREKVLGPWAKTLREKKVDTVVLGCTHFLHVTDDMARLLGPDIRIVDSRNGVGRQVERRLREGGLLADNKTGEDLFLFSASQDWSAETLAPMETKYRVFSERFKLSYGGPWVYGS